MLNDSCHQNVISFRTDDGKREAAGRSFHEIMVRCDISTIFGVQKEFYISRAYTPNQVFVYSCITDSSGQKKIYPENLSLDISIVHDRYNFGNVEI